MAGNAGVVPGAPAGVPAGTAGRSAKGLDVAVAESAPPPHAAAGGTGGKSAQGVLAFPQPAGTANAGAGESPGLSDEAAEEAAEKDSGELAGEAGEPASSSTSGPCGGVEALAGAGWATEPAA
jgi:hypothetical protein